MQTTNLCELEVLVGETLKGGEQPLLAADASMADPKVDILPNPNLLLPRTYPNPNVI